MPKAKDSKRYEVRFSSNYETVTMIVEGSVYELSRKVGNFLTIYTKAGNDKPITINIFPASDDENGEVVQ